MPDEYRLTENFRAKKFWRAVFAEGLGVAIIVFVGCGSMLIANYDSFPHYEPMDEPQKSKLFASGKVIRVSFAFGLAVATATWSIFHVSGAHLNPAVSLGMLATGRISVVRALFYWLGQLLGALIGAGLLCLCIPDDYRAQLGATVLADGVDAGRGTMIELAVTFVLVFTYFASTDRFRSDLNGSIPLTIGLAVVACHLVAFPLTTCSLNPARSFGPAVVGNFWNAHWVYWIGPFIGSLSAALLYKLVFAADPLRRDYTTTTECPLIVTTAPEDLTSSRNPFASPASIPLIQGHHQDGDRNDDNDDKTAALLSIAGASSTSVIDGAPLVELKHEPESGVENATVGEVTSSIRPETPPAPMSPKVVQQVEQQKTIETDQVLPAPLEEQRRSSVGVDDGGSPAEFTLAPEDTSTLKVLPPPLPNCVLANATLHHFCGVGVAAGTPKTEHRGLNGGSQIVQIEVDVD